MTALAPLRAAPAAITPVAFVLDDLGGWGAVAAHVHALVTSLDPRFAPEVIVLGRDDQAHRFEDLGVPVRRVPIARVLGPGAIAGTARLARALRDGRRQLVISCQASADLITPLAAAAVGAVALSSRRDIGLTRSPAHVATQRRVNELLAGMTVASAGVKEAVHQREGFPVERIRVIPDSVDVTRHRADPDARARVRAALGLRRDDVVIGTLADPDEAGAADLVVPAVASLCHTYPAARLLVGGHGALRAAAPVHAAAAQLGDRLLVAGPGHDELALLRACDLFVSTAADGADAAVARQAMAAGLAVVAIADGGSAPPTAADGADDVLTTSRDAAAVAAALGALLADPARRAALATRARARAHERFTPRATATRYEEVFDAHIDQGARARRRLTKRLIASGYGPVRPLVRRVIARRAADHALVLCYHRVVDDVVTSDPSMVVTQGALQRQLEAIGRRYAFVEMDRLATELAAGGPSRPTCAVTFDDGYLDNLTLALPVLRRLGVPATVYLPAGVLETRQALWPERVAAVILRAARARGRAATAIEILAAHLDGVWPATRIAALRAGADVGPGTLARMIVETLKQVSDEVRLRAVAALEGAIGPADPDALPRYLTWPEARQLHAAGIAIGSHTVTHPILPMTSDEAARRELHEARALIEARIGVAPRGFAYPNGDHDARTRALVAASGHTYAVTLDARTWCGDRFAIGRRCVSEHQSRGYAGPFSAATFMADMDGALDRIRAAPAYR